MSEKKDKEARREAKKVKAVMQILLLEDNNVVVNGIPSNHNNAMYLLNNAVSAVSEFFIRKGMSNELDQNFNLKKGNIIVPKPNLVPPGMMPRN